MFEYNNDVLSSKRVPKIRRRIDMSSLMLLEPCTARACFIYGLSNTVCSKELEFAAIEKNI